MSEISRQSSLITPEEYLAGELISKIKHEYLGGIVHAMAGARNVHNDISGNIFAAFHARLRGKKCRPYNSDTKVRLSMPSGQQRFYYPDVQVACELNSPDDTFQDKPVILVEVISPSTRRTDEVEKLAAYTTISTLDAYWIVESKLRQVTVHQRSGKFFEKFVFQVASDLLHIPSMKLEISLAEVYENVIFPPLSDYEQEEAELRLVE